MEKSLKNSSNEKLLNLYTKNKEFLEYLDKEYKNTEKMKDSKE